MLRPVRPQETDKEAEELFGQEGSEGVVEGQDDWEGVLEAVDAAEDKEVQNCEPCSDQEDLFPVPCKGAVDVGDGDWETIQLAQRPVPLAEVKMPSRAEVARHNLTHLQVRNWCIWCRMARTPHTHTPHRTLPACSRAVPLLVFDYCFLRNSSEKDMITVLVARVYPYRAIFAVQSDAKGEDMHTVTRLATFYQALRPGAVCVHVRSGNSNWCHDGSSA